MSEEVTATTAAKFDAVAVVKSKKYRRYADLLCCELDEHTQYTYAEIDTIIHGALARPVVRTVNP
ncbi:hypothetical protein [uncultured Megasphaera sp.]|uniref:hypothetical protein n=1 Tax=uncultured Megasphaera sp. TaxID=165188 RepID=UPI002658C1F3|nr:hypothetical protein [uncultured Megasphaera sp.]